MYPFAGPTGRAGSGQSEADTIIGEAVERTILYFAYGSNLWPPRMRARVPSAVSLGCHRLDGFRLRFGKRGADGSAKADIHFTGDTCHAVYGAVYLMLEAERPVLDRIEGGYNRASVLLGSKRDELRAFTYIAAEPVDEEYAPFDWYRQLLLAGGRHHDLPTGYLQRIAGVETVADPDAHRHAANWPASLPDPFPLI